MGNKYPKPKKTSIKLPIQKLYLMNRYKNILIKDNSSRKIDMDFLIQSTFSSNKYIIKIKYNTIYDTPNVFLLNQNLPTDNKNDIPHIYGIKKICGKEYINLCTFYPKEDWNNSMLIANTVFLWAVEWLYFYEIWCVSGNWCRRGDTSRGEKIVR